MEKDAKKGIKKLLVASGIVDYLLTVIFLIAAVIMLVLVSRYFNNAEALKEALKIEGLSAEMVTLLGVLVSMYAALAGVICFIYFLIGRKMLSYGKHYVDDLKSKATSLLIFGVIEALLSVLFIILSATNQLWEASLGFLIPAIVLSALSAVLKFVTMRKALFSDIKPNKFVEVPEGESAAD